MEDLTLDVVGGGGPRKLSQGRRTFGENRRAFYHCTSSATLQRSQSEKCCSEERGCWFSECRSSAADGGCVKSFKTNKNKKNHQFYTL
ncbi:hypothetical protein CRUP_016386 [Coryphaenoides rupestris]|nr:hypothetical protein CRUP_016386 [Coryphaenoides rupestris]